MMSIDLYLFKIIHGLTGQSIYLDALGIFLAEYLIWFFPIGIFLFLIFSKDKQKKKEIILFGGLTVILFYLFDFLTEKIYFRPRPFVFFKFAPLVNVESNESSFPSAHMALAFIMAFSIYLINKHLGIISFIFALIIGLSRIFVGVHWPSDILVGILFALVCILVIRIIFYEILNFKFISYD